jgi:defect-in-organelle-trafficking protein DotB
VRQGLILVTGPTGSGKTTLLAATVRHILEDPERSDVVLTIESPIEFLYDDVQLRNSLIAQSQIGRHLPSWPRAVRNGLRRAPTTLLIGESRDTETMAATLEACLTGHLTFTTLHTTGVPATVSRMVRMFPGDQRDTAYTDLIEATQLIVSQRLLPGTDRHRVAVREWLALDVNLRAALQDLPPEKTTNTLRTFVYTSGHSFKADADQLLREGRIGAAVHTEFLRSYTA